MSHRTRWEYRQLTWDDLDQDREWKQIGNRGWELVAIWRLPDGLPLFFFKREKRD